MVMVYCAYCGKGFTRKEHLERHIPQHTNVKPHRCEFCQLGFARRDLLQRHHTTYHEPRDPMGPLTGGIPPQAGKTPIACQNCANAKTGCDKAVPCSRCVEKHLTCSARYARRSSKAATRAAQGSVVHGNSLMAGIPRAQGPPMTAGMMQLQDFHGLPHQAFGTYSPVCGPATSVDSKLQAMPIQHQSSLDQNSFNQAEYGTPQPKMDIGDFINYDYALPGTDPGLSEMLPWQNYTLELEPSMYPSNMIVRQEASYSPDYSGASTSEPLTASSASGSVHKRGTSSISTAADFDFNSKPIGISTRMRTCNGTAVPEVDELQEIIVAENDWPLARCNRPNKIVPDCPRVGIKHLEMLERKCNEVGIWDALENTIRQWSNEDFAHPTVVQIKPRTREKMIAITQGYLQKALGLHGGGADGAGRAVCSNFIMLPPNGVLEYFLGSYVRSLEDYYPLAIGMRVDPNDMLEDNEASTLLVLLMIAQGAAMVPTNEARFLSAGLAETCRISLFDMIEKNIELSADPVVLRCALLFAHLGAWCGDKWQMDIAMGQRGMYLSMLKHAGMLEPQPPMIHAFDDSANVEYEWRKWQRGEARNRLVYNWVSLEIELSLFHDTAPLLAVSDLQCPLPVDEIFWQASSAQEWQASVQSRYGPMANVRPQLLTAQPLTPSLFKMFQNFLQGDPPTREPEPHQLRLLLHPIQALLYHTRQMLSCFADIGNGYQTVNQNSIIQQMDDARGLLTKWYEIASAMLTKNPDCSITKGSMVLYHLMHLNSVTSFPEIERLARKEGFDLGHATHFELGLKHKRCIDKRAEAIVHCGQALRLLRSLSGQLQPSWWSMALYRVTLILWTDGIGRGDPSFNSSISPPSVSKAEKSPSMSPHGAIAIDRVMLEDPAVRAFLGAGDGNPCLTRPDGVLVSLDEPSQVLELGIKTIEAGNSTRIGDGIRRKLATLSSNWPPDSIGGSPQRRFSVQMSR